MIGLNIAEKRLYVPDEAEYVIPETPSVKETEGFLADARSRGFSIFQAMSSFDFPPRWHNNNIANVALSLAGVDPDSRSYLCQVESRDHLSWGPRRPAGLFFKLDENMQLYAPEPPTSDVHGSVALGDLIYSGAIKEEEAVVALEGSSNNGWRLSKKYSGNCACTRTVNTESTHPTEPSHMADHNLDAEDKLALVLAAFSYNHEIAKRQ